MEAEKNVASDLGIKSELAFVIGNLVNLEEHLSLTIPETMEKKSMAILEEVRKLRAKYMKEFVGERKLPGQGWCILKHLFATAYRLTEVATKNISLKNEEKAIENLKDARDLFELTMVILNGIDGQPKKEI